MNSEAVWVLEWFSLEDDFMVGDVELKADADVLRRIFNRPVDDDMCGQYEVTQREAPHLERLAGVKIDFGAYAYELGWRAR